MREILSPVRVSTCRLDPGASGRVAFFGMARILPSLPWRFSGATFVAPERTRPPSCRLPTPISAAMARFVISRNLSALSSKPLAAKAEAEMYSAPHSQPARRKRDFQCRVFIHLFTEHDISA